MLANYAQAIGRKACHRPAQAASTKPALVFGKPRTPEGTRRLADALTVIDAMPNGEAFIQWFIGAWNKATWWHNVDMSGDPTRSARWFRWAVSSMDASHRPMLDDLLERLNMADWFASIPPLLPPPDYSQATALPLNLLSDFKALTFAEQTRIRALVWLMPAGEVPRRVATWALEQVTANPGIDVKAMRDLWDQWTRRKYGSPGFFNEDDDTAAFYAYQYVTGDYLPHKRRKLKGDEYSRCLMAMIDALSYAVGGDE